MVFTVEERTVDDSEGIGVRTHRRSAGERVRRSHSARESGRPIGAILAVYGRHTSAGCSTGTVMTATGAFRTTFSAVLPSR